MTRVYVFLTLVVTSMCGNLAVAQVTNQRIDTDYQRLRWVDFRVYAFCPPDIEDYGGLSYRRLSDMSSLSRNYAGVANAGGSTAGQAAGVEALNVTPWGGTIEVPQVTFAAGTVMSALAANEDCSAGATFSFGEKENPCRAYGKYKVIGTPSSALTFQGLMTILITTGPMGHSDLADGGWLIKCGPSELSAVKAGNSWEVEGGVVVNNVYQDLSGFWPLDINTAFVTTKPAQVNDVYELDIQTMDFYYYAGAGEYAGTFYGQSGMSASLSMGSSYSIQSVP
jgi:hypothetical protein